jgi:hypothetical protein
MRTLKGNPFASPTVVVPDTATSPSWSGDAVTVPEAGLDPSVQIMYTGEHVMASVFNNTGNNSGNAYFIATSANSGTAGSDEDAKYGQQGMRRLPLIWWNYPVNDYMTSRIMMGPTPVNPAGSSVNNRLGLNPNAKGSMHGVVANPMQQGTASEVALFGVADYTWNMGKFDAVQNWEYSFRYLFPTVAESLLLFAKHNQQGTYSASYLPRNEESTELKPLMTAFQNAISASAPDAITVRESGASLMAEIDKLDAAIADILSDKYPRTALLVDDPDGGIRPWLEKGANLCRIIRYSVNLYNAYFDDDSEAVWDNYSRAQAEKLEWPKYAAPALNSGSIIVEVGTQHLKPFVDTLLTRINGVIAADAQYDVKTNAVSTFTNIPAYQTIKPDKSGTTYTLDIDGPFELGVSRYLGIKMENVYKLTEIAVTGTVSDGVSVEYSANGAEWITSEEFPAELNSMPVRYVRLVNNTEHVVTSDITKLTVTVAAGESYSGSATSTAGIYQSNVPDNMLTESLSTSYWTNGNQVAGQQVDIIYTDAVQVYDITLISSTTDNIKSGRMLMSEDGEDWVKVMDLGAYTSLETIGSTNYIVERANAKGLTIKYVRLITDGPANFWTRIYSLRLNVNSGHATGVVPPTSLLVSGGWAPNAVDGSVSTVFSAPEETDALSYSLSEFTGATELIVMQSSTAVNNTPIRLLTLDGWKDLGVLDKAYCRFDLSGFDRAIKAEIAWTPETSPIMIHEIYTITRIDKLELVKCIDHAQAAKNKTPALDYAIAYGQAVADDANATFKDVAQAALSIKKALGVYIVLTPSHSYVADAAGGALSASLTVENYTGRDVSYNLYAALYDFRGVLAGLALAHVTAEVDGAGSAQVEVNIPFFTDGYNVKFFLWDAATYAPVLDAVIIE